MPERCSAIIDALIELRHVRGMTQQALADAASMSQSVIARFEKKKSIPQLDTLLKIAEALGCDFCIEEITPGNKNH